MTLEALFTEDSALAAIAAAAVVTGRAAAIAVGSRARGAVDRDALRSALRSLLVGLRVRH